MTAKNPFTLQNSKVVYQNPWITVREDQVTRPGGKNGIFGVVDMVPGASVLPIDEDNNVLLVKEYKYALARETIEVISGGMDKGESPLEAAQRELREEVGTEATEWIDLGSIDPFTTLINCPNYLFLAKGLTHFEPEPDEGEILERMIIPYAQALQMVYESEITHGASCVVILKAQKYLS